MNELLSIVKNNKKLVLISTISTTLLCVVVLIIWLYKRKKPLLPVAGEVTCKFGNRTAPAAGASTFHNGVDIGVKQGTPIRSPWQGEVVKQLTNNAGGIQLVIKHEKAGYQTGYAHLSEYNCKEGDKVKRGDIVAYSGNTGISTGAHLHFTLTDLKTNEKIDPETIFKF